MSFFKEVADIVQTYWPMILRGTGITIALSITGTLIGAVIGLLAGVIKTIPLPTKKNPFKRFFLQLVNVLIQIYVEVFRGTPMIVQAMVIYYGLPQLINLNLDPIPAALFIVSINTGSYMAEIIRGGIDSVDKGQLEGAQAIGMSHFQTMKSIIFPQAIRNVLPSVGNEFIINIKDTSVLNVISVTELFFTSKSLAGTYTRYYEVFIITSAIYFFLTFTISLILRFVEKKIDGPKNFEIAETIEKEIDSNLLKER